MPELVPGAELPELRLTVDVESMKVFTLIMGDPNPIHFDPQSVAALGLGDRTINQGSLNMAYPINAAIAVVGEARRIRSFRCRFLGSVYSGDEVLAGGTVTDVERDANPPVATVSLWLERVGSGRVLEGSAVVDLADPGAPG
jgi:3-hydroxybutyryl-CoA dehydratase